MSCVSVSGIINESSGLVRTLPVSGINKGRGKCWEKTEEKEIRKNSHIVNELYANFVRNSRRKACVKCMKRGENRPVYIKWPAKSARYRYSTMSITILLYI